MIADLSGKTALVTGAASGIGKGIATVLAEQGAAVAVTDIDGDKASETAHGLPGSGHMGLVVDVTDKKTIESSLKKVEADWGKLDILVNNAGVASAPNKQSAEDREEDWDVTYLINVKGVVNCCEVITAHMCERRFGKIINIASIAGYGARRMPGAYGASKAAVIRYTQGLAISMGPHNINVNGICPGGVWTQFQEAGSLFAQSQDPSLSNIEPVKIFHDKYEQQMPLGRVQTPEDIGKMAAFLASEDARNITGQCINVDSGAVIC